MERRLCVVLGSEESGESLRKICQPYENKPPEVGILAIEDDGEDSASLIIVAYEGKGAFSIRSSRGSRITVRGGKAHSPFP
jgi:hypothetical protein